MNRSTRRSYARPFRPKSKLKRPGAAARREGAAARKRRAALERMGDWVYNPPPLKPTALKRIIDILVDAALAHLEWQNVCQQGINALSGIDDTLSRYGKNLPADKVKELKDWGEALWEDLVRLGCPV